MNTLRNKTDRPHTTYGSTRLALAFIAGALLMTPAATQAQVKGSALPVANSLSMADRVMMVTDPSGTPSTKTATLTLLKATMGSGSGDVVGPASAVNNRVVFFDGTTGKLIKDSGLTLSGTNTGDQDLSGYLTSAAAALAYQPLNTNLNLLSALTTSGAGVMKYTNDFGFTAGQLIASDLWNPLGANTVMTFNGSGNGAAITPSAVLDIIGSTRGQILYRGASGWTVLSAGTSGQALTTGGAGADPSWTTVGVSDGDKGSITVSSSGTVWTIDASAVTNSMLAGSISASKVTGTAAILGANTFSEKQTINVASGTPLEIQIAGVKKFEFSSNGGLLIADSSTWLPYGVDGNFYFGGRGIFRQNSGGVNSITIDASDSTPENQSIGFYIGASMVSGVFCGAGSPEGVKAAPPGSLYLNRSGGAGATLYVKESGSGNTGWIAK